MEGVNCFCWFIFGMDGGEWVLCYCVWGEVWKCKRVIEGCFFVDSGVD